MFTSITNVIVTTYQAFALLSASIRKYQLWLLTVIHVSGAVYLDLLLQPERNHVGNIFYFLSAFS